MQMTPTPDVNRCESAELACAYAAQALAPGEVAAAEAHIAACADCRRELESLRPVVARFVAWPTDVLRPAAPLQARLAVRIAEETGTEPMLPRAREWSEPEWEQVGPGVECKLLAADRESHRVSMLVRLAPRTSYPAHMHAGAQELHVLDGELLIDGRMLVPGDYHYGALGAQRVWSETGCSCVLATSHPARSALIMGEPARSHGRTGNLRQVTLIFVVLLLVFFSAIGWHFYAK